MSENDNDSRQEIGSPEHTATQLQHAEKLITELEADVEDANKKVGELESSIESQLKTIQEQSDTLMNREKLVDELKETIEQLRTANETIVAPPGVEDVRSVMGGIEIAELGDALQSYGLNVVRMSNADNHSLIGCAFVKVGWALQEKKTWIEALNWLKGTE